MKNLKILHVPTDCGNHGTLLARTERLLGYDSWSIVFAQSYLGYKADLVIGGRSITNLLRLELKRWKLMWQARKFDVICYNYGSSMAPTPPFVGLGLHGGLKRKIYTICTFPFQMLDVVFFHLLGKTIIVLFQGGDARIGSHALDKHEHAKGYYSPLMDTIKRTRIKIWDKLADHIYFLNPDLYQFLPKRSKFLPYLYSHKEEN